MAPVPFSEPPFPVAGDALKPFALNVPDQALSALKQLLTLCPIPEPCFENSQKDFTWGVTRDWLIKAVDEWKGNFSWREQEAKLNSFPNFKLHVVDDDKREYDMHFNALFSPNKDAIPILFLHGWPGSILEFVPLMTILRKKYGEDPASLPFHIIVPSLPGFCFTKVHTDKNYLAVDSIRLLNKMMIGLGFKEYLVQGGDLGATLAARIAVKYDEVKACHLNMLTFRRPEKEVDPPTEIEKAALQRAANFSATGTAYAQTHATRPSTIGLALQSSPVALLAWIGEKMIIWADEPPSLNEILTNVSLYWFTGCYPTSIAIYREMVTPQSRVNPGSNSVFDAIDNMAKPFGVSWFPKDVTTAPKSWIDAYGKVTFFRAHDKGGHFAALEVPEVLWADVEEFAYQVWGKKAN